MVISADFEKQQQYFDKKYFRLNQNWVQELILAWLLAPFPSSILDETRFETTTFRL
jgi:hypothetical protein